MTVINFPSPPQFHTLEDSARVIGGFCWVERRLFEVLGGWVEVEADLEAKLLFSEHSIHHGWHADLWTERLPVARGLDIADLVVPPTPEAAALLDALAGVTEPDATVVRLASIYAALLRELVAVYQHYGSIISPVSEGPTLRALQLILSDDVVDGPRGVEVLDGRWGGPEVAVDTPAPVAEALAAFSRGSSLLPAGLAL